MNWIVIALGLAALVIVSLGFYAGKLLFLLQQQKKQQLAVRTGRVATISESIHVIAMAMEQQQCGLSEGVIRIVNLLNAMPLDPMPNFKERYPHIYTFFVEVSGFDILEARQKLSKKEKRKQDDAREQIESEYESRVLSELPLLKAFAESHLSQQ